MLGGLLHISKCLLYFPPDVKLLCLLATCCRSRSIKRRPRRHTCGERYDCSPPQGQHFTPRRNTRASGRPSRFHPSHHKLLPAKRSGAAQNLIPLCSLCLCWKWRCPRRNQTLIFNHFPKKLILYSLTWTSQQSLISERACFSLGSKYYRCDRCFVLSGSSVMHRTLLDMIVTNYITYCRTATAVYFFLAA